MGLLDGLLGALTGTGGAQRGGLVEVIGSFIAQQPGGLAGLIEQFQRGGLGDVAQSWVGTGRNLPITPDQLSSLFGGQQMDSLAKAAGVSSQEVSSHMAELLPQMVDGMTPNGSLPDASSVEDWVRSLGRQ
jgi:uncharacterized protein YidB (DUF937 family)